CRTEVLEERAAAYGANARDLVERIGAEGPGALRPVRADGKAVSFVAQALDKVKHRIPWFEHDRRATAWLVKMFASGVAIGPLGDADQGYVMQNQCRQYFARHGKLACATVNQHEIRYLLFACGHILAFSRIGGTLDGNGFRAARVA